jgi:hypothetical protein
MCEQSKYDFRQFVAGFNDIGDQFLSPVRLTLLIAAKVQHCRKEFEEKISKITAAQ